MNTTEMAVGQICEMGTKLAPLNGAYEFIKVTGITQECKSYKNILKYKNIVITKRTTATWQKLPNYCKHESYHQH